MQRGRVRAWRLSKPYMYVHAQLPSWQVLSSAAQHAQQLPPQQNLSSAPHTPADTPPQLICAVRDRQLSAVAAAQLKAIEKLQRRQLRVLYTPCTAVCTMQRPVYTSTPTSTLLPGQEQINLFYFQFRGGLLPDVSEGIGNERVGVLVLSDHCIGVTVVVEEGQKWQKDALLDSTLVWELEGVGVDLVASSTHVVRRCRNT